MSTDGIWNFTKLLYSRLEKKESSMTNTDGEKLIWKWRELIWGSHNINMILLWMAISWFAIFLVNRENTPASIQNSFVTVLNRIKDTIMNEFNSIREAISKKFGNSKIGEVDGQNISWNNFSNFKFHKAVYEYRSRTPLVFWSDKKFHEILYYIKGTERTLSKSRRLWHEPKARWLRARVLIADLFSNLEQRFIAYTFRQSCCHVIFAPCK